jgi:hypothetical protein
MNRGEGRLTAIASLIAAFASVILVASVSLLLIVGLWKLNARTAPALSLKQRHALVCAVCTARRFAYGYRSHTDRVRLIGRMTAPADDYVLHECSQTVPGAIAELQHIHPTLETVSLPRAPETVQNTKRGS